MPEPEQIEYAGLLVDKAQTDERTCAALSANDDMADDPIGFHAQQAVEKAIKAVLVLEGVDFPRTHDLEYLLEVADNQRIEVPEDLRNAEWLTPWAAELRYDAPSAALDRAAARRLAESAVDWARATFERQSQGAHGGLDENERPNAV